MTISAKNRIFALLLVCLLLSGCGVTAEPNPAETPPPQEAVNALPGEPARTAPAADNVFSLNFDPEAGTNPIRAASAANMQFCSLLYDSVYTVDETFTASSELVREARSDDYIWWVFDLNTDICFSDGTPLTAHDIVYSLLRAKQSDYYRERLSCIYGISALSDDCFAITTAYADSQLPVRLNVPVIREGDYFEDWPLGSGPYVLNESHSALERNSAGRHAAELPIDTIYLKDRMDTSSRIPAFEDATIDLVTNDPTGMYNLGYGSGSERRYYDTPNLHFIGFNMKGMYFQFFRTRCALSYAIDRARIVEDIMGGCGVPVTLPVHPKSALYDAAYAETLAYAPDKAAALFEAAGVGDLDDDGALEILVTGIPVELNIKFVVNNDSSVKVAAARQICASLNAMGITTRLYELSWEDYLYTLQSGDFDMYYGELRLAPDWDLSALFRVEDRGEPIVMNYARNADPAFCEKYGAYLAAPPEQRDAAFQTAVRAVCEAGAIVPVCFERRELLTHRGVVSGIRATHFDIFNQFTEWTINLK